MTTILTAPANLGDTKLPGQVAVLDIDQLRVDAPNKSREWFKVSIVAAMPSEGCPPGTDVRWLTRATWYVVAAFPDGTFNMAALQERAPASTDGPTTGGAQ